MKLNVEDTNDERALLNYEMTHLHNVAKHKGVTLNPVVSTDDLKNDAEYGVWIPNEDGTRKTILKFSSLERCKMATARFSGSFIVRLGRNHMWRNADEPVEIQRTPLNDSVPFIASTDESGNIEILEEIIIPSQNSYQLISNELTVAGYYQGSHPPAEFLRNLAMRYNDIVPEEFAAAVVKHCDIPKTPEVNDNLRNKTVFKSSEEKRAWYDTPAGKAWVKEHPVPSIFTLPTPEYIHRRG